MKPTPLSLCVVVLVVLASSSARAQSDCRAPVTRVPGNIIFSPEQEQYLGELVDASQRTELQVIETGDLAVPLKRIGQRLSEYAPAGAPEFQFSLVELPYANAFVLPGGHVYVTRKLATMVRSEDELAGVMAHEMGHVLTRQTARDYSELWRAVLNVTAVTDRKDVEEKFHQFWETFATNPSAFRSAMKRMEEEQVEADTVSMQILARSGYESRAYADFFDRLAETRGKTGNWFTDMFGATKSDSKRLRQIIKNIAATPTGCGSGLARMSAADFSDWQRKLTAFSGFGKSETIPANAQKRVMKEPLRGEITHLRFSPDGKFLLAQDAGSVYVLSREPLANRFRIDSEDARNAEFTPDSKSVVFLTSDLRVHRWDIERQQQTDVSEVQVQRSCQQSALSPMGDYLACIQLGEDQSYPLQLAVLDVRSSETIWKKTGVFHPSNLGLFGMLAFLIGGMQVQLPLDWSTDGRYLAGYGHSGPFAYDTQTKQKVELSGKVVDLLKRDFVFLSPTTLFGEAGDHSEKSAVVKFPTGEVVREKIAVGNASVDRVTKGGYLIIRPIVHYAAGVMDMNTSKIFVGSKVRAIDFYDDVYVNERRNGELGLYRAAGGNPFAVVELPKGPINRLVAIAVSPDLKFIAYSDRSRGAVWNTEDGSRLFYVRGFIGAHFEADSKLLLSFPSVDSYGGNGGITKEEAKQRQSETWAAEQRNKPGVQVVRMTPGSQQMDELSSTTSRFAVWPVGKYEIVSSSVDETGKYLKDRELEVRESSTGKSLWNRKIAGGLPTQYLHPLTGNLVLSWDIENPNAKEIIKADSALRTSVDAIRKKQDAKLLEIIDTASGSRKFAVPVDTGQGSFRIRDVEAVGNTLLLTDSHRRLIIMDRSGRRRSRLFASSGRLDVAGKLLAAETEPGRLSVFDVDTMQRKHVFTFPARIAHADFSADSKRLIVITVDQTFYTFDIT